MFAIEKQIIKETTNDIEAVMYEEDFINDIEDIMEDAMLGLDNDDLQVEEAGIQKSDQHLKSHGQYQCMSNQV